MVIAYFRKEAFVFFQLVAKDRSTFGTGYNGGPLSKVEQLKLNDGDVLEVSDAFCICLQNHKSFLVFQNCLHF